MRARLHVRSAQAAPFEVSIGNTASIGRAPESTVCLSLDPFVSRQHALIRAQADGRYHLTDLGSRNGTFVAEQRVLFPIPLEPGSVIRIADTEITFLVDELAAAAEDRTIFTPGIAPASTAATPAALLVCDIRGFSQRAERLAVDDLAPFLGAWFREIGDAVERSGGTVDKFIGDAMLAYWGERRGGSACELALGVTGQLLALAAARRWPGGGSLEIVVALHHGKATLSNVGLRGERDATIVGDAVNVAFRLEAVAKAAGHRVVLSEDFRAGLAEPPAMQDLGERELKGRTRPMRLFALAG
jgi:adenylate cyclase